MDNKELFDKLDHFESAWWIATDYKVDKKDDENLERFATDLIRQFIQEFKKFINEESTALTGGKE